MSEYANPLIPTRTVDVRLHDGSRIPAQIYGSGPALLLPANPTPIEGEQAEVLRQYGADPALGYHLIEGLRDAFQVIVLDYEGHVLSTPKPDTLTPENVAADLLAAAGAAGADRFVYYGYSWLAMAGLQLALRTDRLAGLIMGGYPPVDGPYAAMLKVTTAAWEMAEGAPDPADEWSTAGMSKGQTRQFVTLYQALQEFDDRAAQPRITCPRLCFAGSADAMDYGPSWGDVRIDLAGPLIRHRAELEQLGWTVRIFDGLDHMGAMQAPVVTPLIREWHMANG